MAATCETSSATTFFDQATQAFGEALKGGVKFQEQVAGYWTDALKTVPTNEFQKKSRVFLGDAVPAAQKNVEEYVKVVDANYKRNVELLKKACEATSPVTAADLQAKAQGLFEAAVEVVKENTTALAQANLKVLELWADVLRQNGATVPPVVVPGVKAVGK